MGTNIKLLILDNDSLMAHALSTGLQSKGIDLIEVAVSASEALRKFRDFAPEICLIDIELGEGPTGIDVAHAMRRINPEILIIFLTSLSDPQLITSTNRDLPAGAFYRVKSAIKDLDALALMIIGVRNREIQSLPDENLSSGHVKLSKSQLEIFRYVAEGHSNIQISNSRVTTVKSTENSISQIAKKFGITHTSMANQRVLLARKYFELIGKI